MSNLLNDAQVRDGLDQLDGWQVDGDAIVRTLEAPDFMTGIRWVDTVAGLAEDANHHPDIDIRYTAITLRLSTHSEGGLTAADLDLAARIDHALG